MAEEQARDKNIINYVCSYPCLWQVSCSSYKDARARENAWKDVASKAHLSVGDCTRRWKSLRDKFIRELKKTKKKTGDGAPGYISCWPLFKMMLFLSDSVHHKSTKGNFVEEVEVCTENDSSTEGTNTESETLSEMATHTCIQQSPVPIMSPVEPTTSSGSSPSPLNHSSVGFRPKKRKGANDEVEAALLKSLKSMDERHNQLDEEELFGRHIAAVLRRLPGREKALVKLQMQQILTSIEYPPVPIPMNFQGSNVD